MSPIIRPPETDFEMEERRAHAPALSALVVTFNALVGAPSAEIAKMQQQFVSGEMGRDEAVSYERYCRYMISTSRS